MSGGWTAELLSSAILEVEIEILGRLLEARRLSGSETPHGCSAALTMFHREMRDLIDEIVHPGCGKLFAGIGATKNVVFGDDETAIFVGGVKRDFVFAGFSHCLLYTSDAADE